MESATFVPPEIRARVTAFQGCVSCKTACGTGRRAELKRTGQLPIGPCREKKPQPRGSPVTLEEARRILHARAPVIRPRVGLIKVY